MPVHHAPGSGSVIQSPTGGVGDDSVNGAIVWDLSGLPVGAVVGSAVAVYTWEPQAFRAPRATDTRADPELLIVPLEGTADDHLLTGSWDAAGIAEVQANAGGALNTTINLDDGDSSLFFVHGGTQVLTPVRLEIIYGGGGGGGEGGDGDPSGGDPEDEETDPGGDGGGDGGGSTDPSDDPGSDDENEETDPGGGDDDGSDPPSDDPGSDDENEEDNDGGDGGGGGGGSGDPSSNPGSDDENEESNAGGGDPDNVGDGECDASGGAGTHTPGGVE